MTTGAKCPVVVVMLIAAMSCETRVSDAMPEQAWTLVPAEIDRTDGVRILVVHDMEGLAGQDDPQSFEFGTPEYPGGQELLAGDVNAVIDGLFAGGATEVHVVDGHGSGNPEPDVRTDRRRVSSGWMGCRESTIRMSA